MQQQKIQKKIRLNLYVYAVMSVGLTIFLILHQFAKQKFTYTFERSKLKQMNENENYN